MQETITVTNSDELKDALLSATGGEVIELVNTGESYAISLYKNFTPDSMVTITAQDLDNPPIIHSVYMREGQNLTFDGVQIGSTAEQAADRADWLTDFYMHDVENVTITNSQLIGYAEGYAQTSDDLVEKIVSIRGGTNIEFTDNYVANTLYGLTVTETVGLTITGNEITQLQGDGIRLGGVQDVLIDDNYIHDFLSSDNQLVHDDMIQIWSASTYLQTKNVTITNNTFEQGEGEWSQTIFIGNEKTRVDGWTEDDLHENIVIENNYIHNSHLHAVYLQGVDGARVANNTILQNEEYVAELIAEAEANGTYLNPGTYLPRIRAESNDSNIEIVDNKVAAVIFNGENIVVEGNGLDAIGANLDQPVSVEPEETTEPETPVVDDPETPDQEGGVITVTNATELAAAVNAASGGETIELADGAYGDLTLTGDYSETLTIRSANTGGAEFDSIIFDGAKQITVEGVHVEAQDNGSITQPLVRVEGGSDAITVTGSELNGPVDDVYSGIYAVHIRDSDNIIIEDNNIHDVRNGVVVQSSDGTQIIGNNLDYLGNDAMKFSGVTNVLIEDNVGGGNVFPGEGAHLDFIQFQSADSTGITIRGNVYLGSSQANVQGIFLDDVVFNDVLIENNIIYTGMIRGINVTAGENISVLNNTVLNIPGAGKATKIFLPEGAVKEGNIESSYAGEISGTNLTVQNADPSDPFYVNDLFVNGTAGLGITLEDLQTIPESLAEDYGAVGRVAELLGVEGGTVEPETPTTEPETPVVTPPETPEVPETPVEEAEYGVFVVDADTDTVLAQIVAGEPLSLDLAAHTNLNLIVASDADGLESVRLELNGQDSRVESAAPYALFGDDGAGDFFDGIALTEGSHSLSITGYSQDRARGEVIFETDFSFTVENTGDLDPDNTETPTTEQPQTDDDGALSLVDSDSSPLETASYDPQTGELQLLFSYDKLTASTGAYADARHIDAFVFDGVAYEIEIHSADGPRDAAGRYIYDETTMENEFTVNIGTGHGADGAPLSFTFTDRADGSGELFTFEIDNQSETETPVEEPVDPMTSGISGTVFIDNDENGVVNYDEDNAAVGATVRLLDGDGTLLETTQVVSGGGYQFLNLAAGDYIVEFPTEFDGNPLITPGQGDDDDQDSDADVATGRSDVISLDEGEFGRVFAGFEAAEPEPVDPGTARIQGSISLDYNGDGIGDEGLATATVSLLDANGEFVAQTFARHGGVYFFDDLPAGDYIVQFDPSLNYDSLWSYDGLQLAAKSSTENGDSFDDSHADPVTGQSDVVTVGIGETSEHVSAIYDDPQTGVVSGRVFIDSDGDAQDNNEEGATGVTVSLLDFYDGSVIATTQTGEDGNYSFEGLRSGAYNVSFPAEFEGEGLVDNDTGLRTTFIYPNGQAAGIDAGYEEVEEVPEEQSFSVFLMNAETDELLTQINAGEELNFEFGQYENVNLAVYSDEVEVESIVLLLNGADRRVENVEPFALFGDNGQGDFFDGIQMGSGDFTLSVSGYSSDRARGELLFDEDFTFSIA